MKLNRHNYEEYFILYMDNELSSEDRREVETFAAENPDLKAELDILLQSKLTPDTSITFGNTDSLLMRNSAAINPGNYEEWLLCYIDNELSPEEIKDVEKFVAAHPEAKKELELLQRVKLQPESIVFADKASLYRKEEEKTKLVAMRWWRVAAAAVLLVAISVTSVIIITNRSAKQENDFATNSGRETSPVRDNGSNQQPSTNPPAEHAPAIAGTNNQEDAVKENREENKQPSVNPADDGNKNVAEYKRRNGNTQTGRDNANENIAVREEPQVNIDSPNQPSNNLPKPENNPYVIGNKEPVTGEETAATDTPKDPLTNNQPNTATPDVTTGTTQSYTTEETAGVGTDNPDNVFASNDGKKNKLRGFFRKITRTFEKRTNIKATDEENRLLIAGLAIKLK